MAEAPSERFEEILRLIWSHLIAANVHLSIWQELRAIPERQALHKKYPGFFTWTSDAHVDRFIHKVCVVTDRAVSQPSVYKLANLIQARPELAPGIDPKSILQRLENHVLIMTEIRAVRDSRSSHWDLNKTPPEPSVEKCQGLLEELNTLLEDIWNAHQPNTSGGRDYYSMIPTGHSDTSSLLDRLTRQ